MSLKTKCFATIVDEKIFIHDSMFELSNIDFFAVSDSKKRQQGLVSIDTTLGEGPAERRATFELALLTDFSFEKWKSMIPIPLARQLIKQDNYEVDEFICSRYWLCGRYFFVTNRPYEEYEECLVIHQVKEKQMEFTEMIVQAGIFVWRLP
jgi:hypothetical protein